MESNHARTKIGYLLNTNRVAKISEILLVFFSVIVLLQVLTPFAGDNLFRKMGVVWGINIFMLFLVWAGIRLRGQPMSDFGLTFKRLTIKESLRNFLFSMLVSILGAAGYMLGTLVMASISGMPESADMGVYAYLHNNIFMLIFTLAGVYVVSSFGEEVVYRAFLINRITELGLDSKYGKMGAVLFSAVIFGLVHFEWGPTGMVSTGLMGLVFGICYLKLKKKLWILVLAHAYLDTILLVQVFLNS